MIFKNKTEVLQDSKSKVNIISKAFDLKLGIKIQKINIRAQKIDFITLKIYRMIVSTFFVSDKDNKEKFFEKCFLLANIKLDVVFGMFFLTMDNADIDFQAYNL